MALKIVQAENIKSVRRRPRRPQHKFNLKALPFEVVPFMIAPVLPGETLQNALLQSRVVTDPIKNRIVGWWKEYYWFYVPHIALVDWDDTGLLKQMMLDPTTDVSTLKAAANSAPWYTFKGGMDWTKACTELVMAEFFRDEGEALGAVMENYYVGKVDQDQWYNSITKDGVGVEDDQLPGVDELADLEVPTEYTALYDQWLIMRDAGIVEADYDDFIKSYGVDVPKAQEVDQEEKSRFRPELLRFVRKWQYPTNHIDPTDGSATSAVSWSIAERTDYRRFFKWPGFLFGLSVTRPKFYLGAQKGSAVGYLNDALSWLPGVLHDAVYTSVKKITHSATDGVLQNQATDYWLDVKDLFLYGDQLVNYAMDQANTNSLPMPYDNALARYPAIADVKALFVTAGSEYVREDGVCHLNVLGKLAETTP